MYLSAVRAGIGRSRLAVKGGRRRKGWGFAGVSKKKSAKAPAVKGVMATTRPPAERVYTFAPEAMDDPAYWSSEGSYFGQAPSAPAPAPVPWYQKLTEAITPLATTALTVYQQSLLQRMQRKRIEQGLPPIPPEEYRAALGPTASAEVGLAPATRNLLLYGGLGLAALLVLPRLLKR